MDLYILWVQIKMGGLV